MVTGAAATARERAWAVAAEVPDPELPMLTLADLGVLAEVEVEAAGAVSAGAVSAETAEVPGAPAEAAVTAWLTPTYSGCPAVAEMAADVDRRLRAAGYADVRVRLRLDPAWSTDLITAEGRRKLAEAGIAPPRSASERAASAAAVGASPRGTASPLLTLGPTRHLVPCPLCGGTDTEELSRFGSTACKALWRCRDCREPFERVKEI
ncbi:1,2-phenylacetyl-CoA epoxidase subunit PaaD [Kitasatospora hibisci]|uniref:1,2-phenylacetyl-CoA epoxidase subunit PaaD n=1 Tax=Kitasatospora hibisci TaxID=3369522 RepID=UPI0037550487